MISFIQFYQLNLFHILIFTMILKWHKINLVKFARNLVKVPAENVNPYTIAVVIAKLLIGRPTKQYAGKVNKLQPPPLSLSNSPFKSKNP